MRILVTGRSGHLGEALMRVLPGRGYEVVGLAASIASAVQPGDERQE